MRVLVIVNPAASNNKAKNDYETIIDGLLRKHLDDFEVLFTDKPGDAIIFASKASGYDRVICVGGDGTLNEVVNGLMKCSPVPSLGIVGVGTGNDYMKSIGLSGSYEELVKMAVGDKSVKTDVFLVKYRGFAGEDEQRYCINVVGAGFDAAITERLNNFKCKLRGKISYLLAFLIEFFKAKPNNMKLIIEGKPRDWKYFTMVLGNGKYFGGGMKICPGADYADGKIDLVGLGKMPKPVLMYNFPKIYKGTHLKVKYVEHMIAREVSIDSEKRVPVEMDGEVVGTLPIDVKVIEKALRITLS